MSFPEDVLNLVEVPLPDDFSEFLFLLLVREEENNFPTIHKNKHAPENFVDIYAHSINEYFRKLFSYAPTGFKFKSKSFLGNYEPDIKQNRDSRFWKDIRDFRVPFRFPNFVRKEHTYILGNTGSGKTQLIQQMISFDVDSCASVIVIDSQKDLIRNLKRTKLIHPGRLVIVDPWDSVNHPLALNLFDIGQDFDDPRQLEQHINTTVSLLDFVISGVLDFELTPTQRIPFNHCIRLLLITPDTTLQTFYDILDEGLSDRHWRYVKKLPHVSQRFFKNSFESNKYKRTRTEIAARLDLILSTPALGKIFSSPQNNLDLGKEMDKGKVILISTDKGFLQPEGCAFFGRYFISLIAQAMMQRSKRLPEHRRRTYVYIDECGDYLKTEGDFVADFLHQGRKFNVGLTLAHQELHQLPTDVLHAVKSNAAIKFIGKCSHADSMALRHDMGVDGIWMPKLSFLLRASCFDNTFPIKVDAGLIERSEQRTDEEMEEVMEFNRSKYCIKVVPPKKPSPEIAPPVKEAEIIDENTPEWTKSDEAKGVSDDPLAPYT